MERGDRKIKERNIGLDIVRVCAALFVIAGHFFVLNTPLNGTKFEGGGFLSKGYLIPCFNVVSRFIFSYQGSFRVTNNATRHIIKAA